jgi:hypothetical protein
MATEKQEIVAVWYPVSGSLDVRYPNGLRQGSLYVPDWDAARREAKRFGATVLRDQLNRWCERIDS